MNWILIEDSVILGVGLAMDAFCVSMSNGLNDPSMRRKKMLGIAGMYAFFQFAMPLTGWICVHTIASYFAAFQKLIPWIALGLLSFIGGKMLVEGIRNSHEEEESATLTFLELVLQGIATSIDALSVGFAISEYEVSEAFLSSVIIAIVTMVISVTGVKLGRKFGTMLEGKANILGGVILIGIGLEIFIRRMFFK